MTESRFVQTHTRFLSPCASCARKLADAPTCQAFPNGIPAAILGGKHSHRTAYPGDGGLHYLKAQDKRGQL